MRCALSKLILWSRFYEEFFEFLLKIDCRQQKILHSFWLIEFRTPGGSSFASCTRPRGWRGFRSKWRWVFFHSLAFKSSSRSSSDKSFEKFKSSKIKLKSDISSLNQPPFRKILFHINGNYKYDNYNYYSHSSARNFLLEMRSNDL